MAKVNNNFTAGRMDSDTHYSLQDNKSFIRAENMRLSGVGDDGSFKNLKGSKLVSSRFTDNGMVVLREFSGLNYKMYYFLAHTNGKCRIVEYDINTESDRIVIEGFLGFDKLRWNNGVEITPYKYLLNVDQIGDLLFFADEIWEYPRVVNITRDYSLGFTEEDIILAKKPPKDAPKIIDWQNNGYDNSDNDVFVSFAYRYKYLDGDYSALSFYSETAFEPKGDEFRVNSQRENVGMVNKFDTVKLMIESGGANVTDIEVYAREHKNNTAYLIYSVNKDKSGIADNFPITDITYKFSKNYQVLNEEDLKLLYSNVPKYPKTQTVAGNRLIYANYKEGFNLKNNDGTPYTIDYLVSKYQTDYDVTGKRNTAVSMFKYKVGVVFYNDYNESTTVLLPTDQTKSEVEIGFADRLNNNHLRVELQNGIPQGFTKMKFVVNSQDLNYDILYITYAKKIGNRVYMYLTNDNVNRVKKGDIITKVDSDATTKHDYTILEVKLYDIDDGLSLKGTYAYFEVNDNSDFILISNGTDVSKNHFMSQKQIDSVNGSSNINRYDATSGYEGTGMSGVPYSSKWNRGTVLISDYGNIKEGDVFKYNISFRYGRDRKGAGLDATDWYGTIVIKEEIYPTKNYTVVFEFLKDNMTNVFLTVTKNGNEVFLSTNSNFPDLVRDQAPLMWDWKVNNEGSREERAVVEVKTTTNLQRGIKPIIFRTNNQELINEMYFETEKTYNIINGQIVPDGWNGTKPVFEIAFYNGYCWENGVESYKIKDVFNEKELYYKFRGSLYEKNGYKQIHRKYDITYSGIYNHELGINYLSVFNPTLANWKTLPVKYGQINHIEAMRGDVSVYFQNGIGIVMYDKSILYDLVANENVATTNDVLGNFVEVSDYFGCNEPESIVKSQFGNFLVDKKRRRFLLHNERQIEELNAPRSGFHDEGINLLKDNHTFLGSFNESFNEYVLGVNQNFSIVFSVFQKGFTAYYRNKFDYILGMGGSYYTAYKGKIYHDEVTDDYNNRSGQGTQTAKIVYVVNPEIDSDKIFKAHYLQSNTAWDTCIKTNITETEIAERFYQQKESFYYTDIFRDIKLPNTGNGVGIVKEIDGDEIVFTNRVSDNIYVGDSLVSDETKHQFEITEITGDTIKVLGNTANINIGDFCYTLKQYVDNYSPDGAPMRGKWMEVTLTKNTNEPIYITSVSTEIIKSAL